MRRWSNEHGFVIPVAIFIALIIGGSFVFQFLEGSTYIDALYFCVITATTVGYGDIVPLTISGKIFTIIYSFLVIGMAFYFFTLIGRYFFKKGMHRTHLDVTNAKKRKATRRIKR